MKLSNFIVIYVLLKFILYNTIKSIDSKEDPNDSLLSDEYKHDIHPTNQKKGKCHKKIGEILLIRKNPENLISHNKLIILNADQTGLLLVDSKKQSLIKKISFNQISNINNEITTKSEGFPIQNCFKITFTNKSNNSDIFMCARNKLEKSTWINSIKDLKNCQRTTSLNNNNGI